MPRQSQIELSDSQQQQICQQLKKQQQPSQEQQPADEESKETKVPQKKRCEGNQNLKKRLILLMEKARTIYRTCGCANIAMSLLVEILT
ncbi:hypothetical protein MUCCIDRAFT_116004 [Mucor lusitanicus CBS 277.49]|uniref:Uncharacterized protein n=1 Tax=Mucor lusitanicus CBS 277.49 TaxID=747725 RepID=A0A162YAB8_MUCCL|nr:hypothetical protein MUCCIDRAFT_116004 [Mucor lusitanicus CBS 277.49]